MSVIDQIITSVANSSAAVDFPELPRIVARAMQAHAGRAAAIAERNQERAAELRDLAEQDRPALELAVKLASKTIPPDFTLLARARLIKRRIASKPDLYNLHRKPTLAEVKKILARTGADR